MKKDTILVDEKEYPVFIHQEDRLTARCSIGKTGVHIRLPLGMCREHTLKETLRLKHWAIQKIKEKQPKYKHKGMKTYNDNDILKIGNETYFIRLQFSNKQGSSARAVGNSLHLNISNNLPEDEKQNHIAVLLSRLIAQEKRAHITQKVHELNKQHFNFDIDKVFLKYNTSNWGSCSTKGNINISTRLLFAPEEVIDYVCIHELAHLQERNHSPAFWNLVERAMPNYKEKKQWLKENAHQCWF